MIIAIDGPTASGKSTVARQLANKLHIYYVSTGLFYRAMAYILVNLKGYKPENLSTITEQDILPCLDCEVLKYTYSEKEGARIFYKGEDLTPLLKTEEIDYLSSLIATNELVRSHLVEYQRQLAQTNSLVMEGRDIGSVVFPNADIKIFLTASLDERAKRWQKFQAERGKIYSLEESKEKINERDKRDTDRKISPLIVAHGAVVIDDTNLSKEETLQKILTFVQKKHASSS